MFYELLYPLKDYWFGFNVFRYITFRASMAAITAFALCLVFGPFLIRLLKNMKVGQYVRKDHVEGIYDLHKNKQGTPTMGGIILIISVLISTLLWADISNDLVLFSLGGMIWLGIIGFMDDCIKLRDRNSKGIHAMTKIAGQVIMALIIGLFVIKNNNIGTELYLPFIKNSIINLGIFNIVLALFVIVGASNAVNLTDGLDGLATGCIIFVTMTYAIMSYVTGHADLSKYLQIFYLPGAGELTVFCAALTGAGMGFLWFNAYPASIFLGDTGSLSIGGAIAIISVLIKKEFLLIITGGVLVVEALSVIIQVASFKFRGKRVFLMAPIHHHFEMRGVHESKITVRFYIISAILALISLASLKVR